MRRSLAVALLAALGACRAVEEPEIAPGWDATRAQKALSHADCVRLACAYGPARAAWGARFAAAAARLRQAGVLPNPSLLVEWEDFRLFAPVPDAVLQQTFSLSMAIGEVLSRGRRREIAQKEVEATLAELAVERRQLALEVCRSYDEVVAARAQAELARADAELVRRQARGMRRLADAGIVSELAARQAETEAVSAGADAATAEHDAAALELALAFALGFERPVALELSEPLRDAPRPASDLESLLATATASRPELRAARAHYRAELGRLRLAGSAMRFVPLVGAGYRRIGSDQLGVASIDVALPIFDAGGAEVAAADAGLQAAASAARRAAHEVARDVCAAVAASAAAAQELEQRQAIAAHRQRLAEAARRWFDAGELGYADLREPVAAAQRARRDVVAAQLALARASWPLRIDALLADLPAAVPGH